LDPAGLIQHALDEHAPTHGQLTYHIFWDLIIKGGRFLRLTTQKGVRLMLGMTVKMQLCYTSWLQLCLLLSCTYCYLLYLCFCRLEQENTVVASLMS
jgi:hypothetical protein